MNEVSHLPEKYAIIASGVSKVGKNSVKMAIKMIIMLIVIVAAVMSLLTDRSVMRLIDPIRIGCLVLVALGAVAVLFFYWDFSRFSDEQMQNGQRKRKR